MKKNIFSSLCGLLLISFVAIAQKPTTGVEEVTDARTSKILSKRTNITQDKTDVLEITGTSNSTFSTSNTFDGTPNSYKHSLRITVALLTSGVNKGNYQLVFYSQEELMPFAAASNENITNVYYPISMYEAIKLKLEQFLAAKKRIQLKVTQKVNGFNEGTLVF